MFQPQFRPSCPIIKNILTVFIVFLQDNFSVLFDDGRNCERNLKEYESISESVNKTTYVKPNITCGDFG